MGKIEGDWVSRVSLCHMSTLLRVFPRPLTYRMGPPNIPAPTTNTLTFSHHTPKQFSRLRMATSNPWTGSFSVKQRRGLERTPSNASRSAEYEDLPTESEFDDDDLPAFTRASSGSTVARVQSQFKSLFKRATSSWLLKHLIIKSSLVGLSWVEGGGCWKTNQYIDIGVRGGRGCWQVIVNVDMVVIKSIDASAELDRTPSVKSIVD